VEFDLVNPSDDAHGHFFSPISLLAPDLVTAPASWLGHVPFAFWIIEATRPATFVELGTHTGNSYSAFCQAVKTLGLPTACSAVDTWGGDPQAGYYGDEVYRTLADFHDPRYGAFSRLMRMTFDEAAGFFNNGSIDLLHIDGLHTYEAVRHDFETWRPKLSRRGVVLFHDINVRKNDFGVWRLWEELSTAHPHFAFLHSNGLGVLGVGEDLPEAARRLFEIQKENGLGLATVRRFFNRLGQLPVGDETIQQLRRQEGHLREEVAMVRKVLDDQIAHTETLKTMIADRDRDIATIQGWNHDHVADIERLRAELATTISNRDRDIVTIQERVRDHAAEIEHLRGEVAARDRQISSLMNSTSWKVSAPVRKLGRLGQLARRLLRDRTHHMTLNPLHDVRRDGDHYESTGSDPAFRLTSDCGVLPGGWCLITYHVTPDSFPLVPVLYVDDGNGLSEINVIRLPVGATGTVRQLALLPPTVVGMRLDPTTRPATFELRDLTIREMGRVQLFAHALGHHAGDLPRLASYVRRNGWRAAKHRIVQELLPKARTDDYSTWLRLFDTLTERDRRAIRAHVDALPSRPRFSIVMPVYNTPEIYLREALESVLAQIYPDWELCIADDASPEAHVSVVLSEYAARDARIKVVRRPVNGHIAAASNSALELAEGDFVALMDHDDTLPPHALYAVAEELNRHPDADILYSDEDKIDERGRRYDPHFKSDFNPDLLLGQNMINHLGVFRRSLLTELGGFRVGFEGSQDYDLTLRAVEKTAPERIRHLPFILYHWRVFESSAAFSTVSLPRATAAAHRALNEHFERTGIGAQVEPTPDDPRFTRIRRALPDPLPRVSLIIPTRDRVELLRGCVEGLRTKTDYPDLEILIVDNNSEKPETLAYFDSLKDDPRVRVLPYVGPFNFSAINNHAAAQATGSVLGLINNDIEVIEPGWLKEMVSHAVRPEVGAVGAKLYYANDTVQHAGVIIGICGVAGHSHKSRPRPDFGYFSRLRLTQDLSCVTAACLLLRKSVYEEVGGLDADHLAVAFNDVDFCLRIREKGYLIVWTPFAELYHLESASRGPDTAPDKVERFKREITYMQDRWGENLAKDPYYNPNLTLDAEDFGLAFPPRVEKPWNSSAPKANEER
jgi:O-antigen biosynthesis protein